MVRARKVAVVVFLLVAVVGTFWMGRRSGVRAGAVPTDKLKSEIAAHPLLSQRIFSDEDDNTIINFEPLRSKLRADLEPYGTSNASLYFEYLPNGTSIRAGDNTQLVGASLLKLPFVMDLYHLEEYKDFNMDDKVALKKEWLNSQYGDLYKKGEGYKVSVKELVRAVLEDSDNTALLAIKAIVAQYNLKVSESSFNALDIDYAGTTTTELKLTARAYSSFPKCLYYSCYLTPEHSQEILGYLTHSKVETDRLTKYLPKNLTVAHKIGIFGDETQGDCGIVYLSHRNYVLCVLINDNDINGSNTIAKISKDVYDYVSSYK
ncbi:hypothetical protein BH10PAT3_BH10PAT3_8700 [soil metagenome]